MGNKITNLKENTVKFNKNKNGILKKNVHSKFHNLISVKITIYKRIIVLIGNKCMLNLILSYIICTLI